jgi:transposase
MNGLSSFARLLDGEKMAAVCRDFNVSRKTGYKILKRHNDVGWKAWPIARGDLTGTPISCRSRSRR